MFHSKENARRMPFWMDFRRPSPPLTEGPDTVQDKKGEEKELHRFVHHPVQTDRIGTYKIAEKSNGIL
jgi:hypothetical protein